MPFCKGHKGYKGMLGKHHTKEAKRKISKARKGKILSEEHKRRVSEGMKRLKGGITFIEGYEKEYGRRYYKMNSEKVLQYGRQWRKRRRKWVNNYKLSRGCVTCGYNKCAEALDFHHEGDKEFDISTNIWRKKEILKKEMDKCKVLCRNCHAELHEKLRKKGGE